MAALTDEQKKQVAAWLEDGAKPADVQNRLESEFELRMTYMEVRFLIDDLKLMPKDPTPPPPPTPAPEAEAEAAADAPIADEASLGEGAPTDEVLPPGDGVPANISVKVDSITRPGAMVSGSAVMSDGKKVDWYLDQYGRLGMVPPEPGYRPAQSDLVGFQMALEKELSKQGY